MSATLVTPKTTSGGEIITHLINSSDGQGIHLDGSTGFIDIPTVPDLGTKLSFEFIIQAHNWGVGTEYIFDFGTSGRTLLYNSGNNLALEIGGASGLDLGVDVLGDGEVHHLVLAIDGTSLKVYDNANEVASKTIALPTIDAAVDGVLGARFNGATTYCFNGIFYRARFWNKTLTQAEVTASYENATVPFADQYGNQTDLVNANSAGSGTAWTGATGTTPPTGWAAMGSNRVYTIDSSSGSGSEPALKINSGAAGSAGIKWSGTPTLGKTYKATFSYKNESGCVLRLLTNDGADVNVLADSTSWTHNATIEWTGSGAASDFILQVQTANKDGWFDNVEIQEIGCVADYDLAFANPSPSPNGQSLMVRDRASVADGTSSATGVTQVTPIEQLNAKAARIGTSAATPADSELMVSGDVLIGDGSADIVGYNRALTVATHTAGQISAIELVSHQNGDADLSGVEFVNDTTRVASIFASRSGADNSGKLSLATGNAGVVSAKMTIDPAGVTRLSQDATLTTLATPALMVGGTGTDSYALNAKHLIGFNYDATKTPIVALGYDLTDTAASTKGSLIFATRDTTGATDVPVTRMTIDSAGTTTISPTGNVKGLYFPTSPTTTDNVIQVDADSLTDGRMAYFKSNASSTNTRSLVYIKNDDPAATGTTCFEVRNDSTGKAIYANGGGIVERYGVLKENLLTNSGFDVWSNSTLENATGTELATNGSAWTGATGATPPNDFSVINAGLFDIVDEGTGGFETALRIKVNTTPQANPRIQHASITTVVGKLYKFSFYAKKDAAVNLVMRLGTSSGGTEYNNWTVQPSSWTEYTHVFEATATTCYIDFYIEASVAGNFCYVDQVTLFEKTPGCVNDGNSFGADTQGKDSTLDCFREHWNGSGGDSDTTKSGSFYALRTLNGAANRSYYLTMAVEQNPTFLKRIAGRTVTFGAWVKTSTASHARLGNYDGASYEHSAAYCPGDGNWHWMELTRTFPETAAYPTYARFFFHVNVDAATAYFSQPTLVWGSAIGEGGYSRPHHEFIELEVATTFNGLDGSQSISSNANYNVEAETNGKIPKGAYALNLGLIGESASVEYTLSAYGPDNNDDFVKVYSQVANVKNANNGIVGVNTNAAATNGFIRIGATATFNSVSLNVNGVYL